ncbi:hypothetical protein SCNU_02662 [Gordonia neofelifaecis NRRL B-59395]|uniref:Secreted protein n=1 Tax=Gordonia neofelifaecis NRRL B-59395 TaxID=644548 RepID=F1YF51_9ACTN|nr:hypothetical protein SCNU_02662 [Gordonia neofelifaecis NRRL B-59395]
MGVAAAAVGAGIGAAMAAPGVAAASTVQPFQIQAAPFGNPNGSFDAPPIRCGLETGVRSGQLTVTGIAPGRWGCPPFAQVRWANLSTGRTGVARLSAGLNGRPAEATLSTGRGQVVLALTTSGIVTPGFATIAVP